MRLDNHCLTCALGAFIKGIEKIDIPQESKEKHIRSFLLFLSETDYNICPPVIGKKLYTDLMEISGNDDPFREIKLKSNYMILDRFDELSDHINSSTDPFETALKLSVSGNLIDFATQDSVTLENILHIADSKNIDPEKIKDLKEELSSAESILYLGDNAGEIVFDKLFLIVIKKLFKIKRIIFSVRGGPIINDATITDAELVKIDQVAEIVDTGDNMPGINIEECSERFVREFNSADLIISKGQGNFESLSESEKNIWFLLITKCQPVAIRLGKDIGALVVKKIWNT